MNRRLRVMVEVLNGRVIRIFRTAPALADNVVGEVMEYPRRDAVADIRQQVFERSGGQCEFCGAWITARTMHLHEGLKINGRWVRNPRGRDGEVSLANCAAICGGCHEWRDDSEHGDRRPQFTEFRTP